MKKVRLAVGLVTLVAVLQFLVANWGAVESLLLALGLDPALVDLVKTVITLLLTLLGGALAYNVATGRLQAWVARMADKLP